MRVRSSKATVSSYCTIVIFFLTKLIPVIDLLYAVGTRQLLIKQFKNAWEKVFCHTINWIISEHIIFASKARKKCC